MALYQFEKRRLTSGMQSPLRWMLWWDTAFQRAKGLYLSHALATLSAGDVWVVADITAAPAIKFMTEIPGWVDPGDEYGAPISFRKLSPKEEMDALRFVPTHMLQEMIKYCEVPPDLPRKNRRMAERAFQSIVDRLVKQRMRAEAEAEKGK